MSLVLREVNLSYTDADTTITALDHVCMEVSAGELVAVVGPSGSGKSSLLAVAGTLLLPDSGLVLVDGTNVTRLGQAERSALRRDRIGLVFQQPNLLSALAAKDQLLVAAHLAGHRPRDRRRRALDLLDAVGVAHRANRRPHQLSGGERQRVNIARALMNEPSVLLVDEPTSALDHERGRRIVELIAEVTRHHRVATVLVTHDREQLDRVDRVVEMHDGRLTAVTPTPA
ncbi:ABC transporter ATP-binding protein [Longimycelium tulufanense]|uniref:ABC transporter ATP-binding protein n=1 Tax=Longimycelium tulufanense TaxID=907463 RepID=A0A8J3C8N6_9PSEU|nr:ABC transporter ATP-binding protein [Longimycelium tulufanense]GGM56924.1 ABC transporter ATP-binding protein [Longimycelium tulufanense]